MLRRVCVTGGAGFIGSNFVDKLLSEGIQCRIIDNYRTGRPEFVPDGVEMFEGDVKDTKLLLRAFDGCDWVAHFQANPDVRHGLERPFFDLEENGLATARVLDAMRQVSVRRIFFASSASTYGNLQMPFIPEDAPFPIQASLYGASKVYCEGLIGAYCEGFGFTGVVGRWTQVLGERYLHGHAVDLIRKGLADPTRMEILGDGEQRKAGIYVKDLVDAIFTAMKANDNNPGTHIYNIGTDATFSINESAALICKRMGINPTFEYTGRSNGGWVGDNPIMQLNTEKIKSLGWKPTRTIPEAVLATVEWLLSDECTYL